MQYKRCGSRFCESGQNNLKGYKSPCWCANARRYTLSPAHPPCRCPEDLKESDIVTGDCKYGAHAGTIPVSVKLKVVYINQELGLGVLANQDIEKGTLICEAVGEVSSAEFLDSILLFLSEHKDGCSKNGCAILTSV